MSWQQAHERAAALDAVLTLAEQQRDGSLDLDCAVGVFASREELLLAVLCRWERRLLARLDAVVERDDGATCEDVAREVARLARQFPGLSAVVAAHLDEPALADAWRRCAALVGMATGLPMEVELAGQLRGAVAGTAADAA